MSLRKRINKLEGDQPPPSPPDDGLARFYPLDLASVLDFGCANSATARAKAEAAARTAYERDKGVKLHPDARAQPYFKNHDDCERYGTAQQAALIASAD